MPVGIRTTINPAAVPGGYRAPHQPNPQMVNVTLAPGGGGGGAGAAPVQSFNNNGVTGAATTAVLNPPAGGCALGNTLILVAASAGAGVTVSSVADSQGNTWTVDQTAAQASAVAVGLASGRLSTALTSTDTITVTYSGSTGGRAVVIAEYSGLLSSSFVDSGGFGINSAATGTTLTATGAGNTAQANELVIGAFGLSLAASSPVAGGSFFLEGSSASTGTIRLAALEDLVVSSIGTQAATLSWTGSTPNVGIVGTYKANTPGGGGSVTTSASIARTYARAALTASVTATATLAKQVSKSLAATVTATATATKQAAKTFTASVTSSASLVKKALKSLSAGPGNNAGAFVQAFNNNGVTGGATTAVVNVPAGGCSAGNTLILGAAGGANNQVLTGVTDSKGNTWTVDQTITNPSNLTADGGHLACSIASSRLTSALVSGDTITATYNLSTGGRAVQVAEYSGLLSSSYVDSGGFGTNVTAAVTSATATGAGTTAQASELVIGMFVLDNAGSSPVAGGGYNLRASSASTGTVRTTALEDAFVNSVGTQSAGMSWTGSSVTAEIVATYEATTSGGGGVTATASLVAGLARRLTLTSSVTATATLAKLVSKTLAASVTATAAVAKQVGKPLTASVTATATITKRCGKALAPSVTATTTLIKLVGKLLTASVTATATATGIKVVLRTLTASVTATASLTKQTGKILAASVTTTATLAKLVGKIVTASVTATASLAKRVGKALSASATTSAAALKSVGKILSATATTAGSISKRCGKSLAATATTSATQTRRIGKLAIASVTPTATLIALANNVVMVTHFITSVIGRMRRSDPPDNTAGSGTVSRLNRPDDIDHIGPSGTPSRTEGDGHINP